MGGFISCGEVCACVGLVSVRKWLESDEGLDDLMDGYILYTRSEVQCGDIEGLGCSGKSNQTPTEMTLGAQGGNLT